MSIVTADSSISLSRFAELASYSTAQQSANDAVTSAGTTTTSAFELLLSQQTGGSVSAGSAIQFASSDSNALNGEAHKQAISTSHSDGILTFHATADVTGSFMNSAVFLNDNSKNSAGNVTQAVQAPPSATTGMTTDGTVAQNSESNANPQSHGENVTATNRPANFHLLTTSSDVSGQGNQPATGLATTDSNVAAAPGQFSPQNFAGILSNAVGSGSGSDSIANRAAAADAEDQWFLVSEFSVESIPALSAANASAGSMIYGLPTENDAATVDAAKAVGTLLRPAPRSNNLTGGSSAIIPVTTSASSTNVGADPSISDQLATAVTRQLEDEPNSGVTIVRIQLDREDLGTLSLQLSVNHNVVSVRIVAPDQLARQIIDSQMKDLRQSLTDKGVTCGQFQIVCDSNQEQSSNQKRSPRPLIALGFASNPRPNIAHVAALTKDLTEGRLNVVA